MPKVLSMKSLIPKRGRSGLLTVKVKGFAKNYKGTTTPSPEKVHKRLENNLKRAQRVTTVKKPLRIQGSGRLPTRGL
jgi:hypothetical protein